jgi:hypothetical protein
LVSVSRITNIPGLPTVVARAIGRRMETCSSKEGQRMIWLFVLLMMVTLEAPGWLWFVWCICVFSKVFAIKE